jgi:hypothetical protein
MSRKISRLTGSTCIAAAMAMVVAGYSEQAVAMPFATSGAGDVVAESQVVEVQNRRVRPAPGHRSARAKNRNRNNAAIGAVIGLGVLGLAAAAAANQPRRGEFYTDQWGNPVDAYGRPLRAARPVQRYEPYYGQQQFYGQQQYYEPGYYRQGRGDAWREEQFRAQRRAERDAARQAQREQIRQQQRWAERQNYQRYQPQPGYDARGPRYAPAVREPGGGFDTSGNRN